MYQIILRVKETDQELFRNYDQDFFEKDEAEIGATILEMYSTLTDTEVLPADPEALDPQDRGEDCVVGSSELRDEEELSEIEQNLKL
jgi:hypothetical protein